MIADERLAINLDHIGWWVDDIEASTREFEGRGFTVTRPASLLTGAATQSPQDEGQLSSHVMFQNTYLELTTVIGDSIPPHLLEYRDGSSLKIIAFGCADADTKYNALLNLGWDVVAPGHSQRELGYGDRTAPVRFRWFMAAPSQFPEVLVCVVQHLDRERLFDPVVSAHANGVRELTEVMLLTDDPQTALARYRPLEAGADEATGWLSFVRPRTLQAEFPAVKLPQLADGSDCVPVGIVLTADSRGETSWFPGPGGTIVVVETELKNL